MNLTKVLIFFFFLTIIARTTVAQLPYLRLSPLQKIEQRVGMTDVTIEFSRPQIKGRKVFGGLVPYGKMWRTGANENTKVSFSHHVKIGTSEVPAGEYSLFTRPGVTEWEIYLYRGTNNLDVPNPIDNSKLLYLTKVTIGNSVELEETLVINFYNITETIADLGIRWENTEAKIPIEFYTQEVMEAKMKTEFGQNALDYSIAAAYYYGRDIELEKAKRLQELSIELREKPSSWA